MLRNVGLLRKLRTAPQEAAIRALNPVIRGWTNYYKGWVCSQTFSACEYTTFKQLARWEQARHPKRSKQWLRKRYTIEMNGSLRFATHVTDKEGKSKALYVRKHTDTLHQNYVKVRGRASPYDGNLVYWAHRLKQHIEEPCDRKRSCTVCAVRRFEIFLLQAGGTRKVFLSYQLTQRRKPKGTRACWASEACLKAL